MVVSDNAKAGPYDADGVQKVFPFTLDVRDPAHVTVYDEWGLVSRGYVVSLWGGGSGGEVVFDVPPVKGTKLAILRQVPIDQETDIQNNTALYPEIIEEALDKLTLICQQLNEAVGRAFQLPVITDMTEGDAITLISQIAARRDLGNLTPEGVGFIDSRVALMQPMTAQNKVTLKLGAWSATDAGVFVDYGEWTPEILEGGS